MQDKAVVIRGNLIDLLFYNLFCRSVVVAGVVQTVLLAAGFLGAAWFYEYLVMGTYSWQMGTPGLFWSAVMQFSSLLNFLWGGAITIGLTVLVARWKGVRWAAQMVCVLLLCVVFAAAATAAYASTMSDSAQGVDCVANGTCMESGL